MTAPDCLFPGACPVPDPNSIDQRRIRTARWPAGTRLWSTYRVRHFPSLFNDTGLGDARFSPLPATDDGPPPVLYLARNMTVSLLETAFHDVHTIAQADERTISVPRDLAPRGAIEIAAPTDLTLVDLRDDQLERHGLGRHELVTTTAAHYRCTRQWADALLRQIGSVLPVGVLWNSRVAELARDDSALLGDLLRSEPAEVAMVVGHPHSPVPIGLDDWHDADRHAHHRHLVAGTGRRLVEEVAQNLGATIVE